MTPAAEPNPADAWESAYLRFETPQEERRKFAARLSALGAGDWPKDAAILEIFSGRGNGLAALEALGFRRIHGVDLSWSLAALHRGQATCCVGDCRQLPVRTGSQDVVIVQGGLHHLPSVPEHLDQVLAEVQRVLAPAGRFIVVEPWLTPFLRVVHRLGCSRIGRRAWSKMDALATMIDLEGETYQHWLRQPDVILNLLRRRFETRMLRRRWGKLWFVGVTARPRDQHAGR